MHAPPSEFQDQLVRGLTHRMNNILTLFHGYVGMMLDNQKLDKSTRDGLSKIKEGAQAASELMDRTHSLVRPSAVIWRELDLTEFLPMLRHGMQALCGEQTRLEFDFPDELPLVWADAGRLKTAIIELLRNACEAIAGRPGTVRLELRAETPGGGPGGCGNSAAQPIEWVSITIADDGPGVAPGMEEKIFDPFFSTKRKQNAAGLGLNVVSGLVNQLGGTLRHESEPGRTRFQILLPSRAC